MESPLMSRGVFTRRPGLRVSRDSQDLVADQVKSDRGRHGTVEVEGFDGFLDVAAKLLPGIGLREDALGQALGHETAVPLLSYLKGQLAHDLILADLKPDGKLGRLCGSANSAGWGRVLFVVVGFVLGGGGYDLGLELLGHLFVVTELHLIVGPTAGDRT